ncbi:MAG TPA: patatin-like phospholipase family protein [Candidatus Saccharimonadales bacterium]|nr:patatin-like phospholipase family protein [Candidatus Saccharimonadales bacterium]
MSNPEASLLGEWLGAEQYELAMPAGWLRVFAHTGTLKALEKHGVEPTSVRGASAGAEAGGLYAAGMDPEDIEKFLIGIRRKDVWDPDYTFGLLRHGLKSRTGFLKGRLLEGKFREAVGDVQIQDLAMKLSISVTDVLSWDAEALTEGDLPRAMTASSAFPFWLQPQLVNGRPKLDGGIKDHAGLADSPKDERTFFAGHEPHGFRSRFDRGDTEAFEGRTNIAVLEIPGIPSVSPFALEEGKAAINHAMEYTEQALYLPVEGQFGEI